MLHQSRQAARCQSVGSSPLLLSAPVANTSKIGKTTSQLNSGTISSTATAIDSLGDSIPNELNWWCSDRLKGIYRTDCVKSLSVSGMQ